MRNYFALMAALTLFALPIGEVEASKYIRMFGTVQSVDTANNVITIKEQSGTVQEFSFDQRSEFEVEERKNNRDYDTSVSEVKVGDIVDVKAFTPMKTGEKPLIKDLEINR